MATRKAEWIMKHQVTQRERRSRIVRGLSLVALLTVAGTCRTALAQDDEDDTNANPALGMDPSTPNVGALPGGVTPAYGQPPAGETDWRFDFHGLLTAPLRAGINTRQDRFPNERQPGQSNTVLHAPPQVPDDKETFSHTGVVPTPYTQLNFSYGTSLVIGTVSIVAEQADVATGFFDPPSQVGINDVFLTVLPKLDENIRFRINVGAFSSRYGSAGEYDLGRYGTPIIATINGAGESIATTVGLGDVTLMVEHGIQGSTNTAPSDVSPDGWNDFADASIGATFANHLHAGIGYAGRVQLGGHYITAWSQDDRASGTLFPDGSIDVLGADLRLNLGRFGHLYGAVAHTNADHSRTVGRTIEILNAPGGPGLMDNYLGPGSQGTGKLLTIGGQYDLSLGKLVSYPVKFTGDGPDLVVSLFGLTTKVQSDDKSTKPYNDDPDYDDVRKWKMGIETTYSLLSWFAASLRYDRVTPDTREERESFAVISPRLIFHSDWESTDQVVLQYSHWINGSLTTIRTGYPPREDPTAIPDEDMVSLSASMWW